MIAERRSGSTSAQLRAAPQQAVFIWCNSALAYPNALARHLGRSDLKIVSPQWLEGVSWRGMKLTGVVVDHATVLSERQHRIYSEEVVPALSRLQQSA